MHHLDAQLADIKMFQFLAQEVCGANQGDAHAELGGGEHRPLHFATRGLIATHGVHCNCRKDARHAE